MRNEASQKERTGQIDLSPMGDKMEQTMMKRDRIGELVSGTEFAWEGKRGR